MICNRWIFRCAVSTLLVLSAPAWAAKDSDMFDMMDQFDKLDKQGFQAAVDRANACTRSRNFSCTTRELANAKKLANSAQDQRMLLAAQQNVSNEKQKIVDEAKQAEQQRLAQIRQEEERQARAEREQERARMQREQQSLREYNAAIDRQITKRFADDAALSNRIDRQTNAATRDSIKILGGPAAALPAGNGTGTTYSRDGKNADGSGVATQPGKINAVAGNKSAATGTESGAGISGKQMERQSGAPANSAKTEASESKSASTGSKPSSGGAVAPQLHLTKANDGDDDAKNRAAAEALRNAELEATRIEREKAIARDQAAERDRQDAIRKRQQKLQAMCTADPTACGCPGHVPGVCLQ